MVGDTALGSWQWLQSGFIFCNHWFVTTHSTSPLDPPRVHLESPPRGNRIPPVPKTPKRTVLLPQLFYFHIWLDLTTTPSPPLTLWLASAQSDRPTRDRGVSDHGSGSPSVGRWASHPQPDVGWAVQGRGGAKSRIQWFRWVNGGPGPLLVWPKS